MIAALLLAAAPLPSAVAAERAFAVDAHRIGLWTAFHKYALPDAVMFTPQAVFAHDFLKGRKDPPKSFDWLPTQSFLSCDGRTAVNLGSAVTADGKPMSQFTTVWLRDGRNWKWTYDGGVPVDKASFKAKGAKVKVVRARCSKAPGAPVIAPQPMSDKQARKTPEDSGRGESADKTLGWDWKVEKDGSRHFRVFQWNGHRYAQVVYQHAPAE
ncbi:MAG: hypothetical protein ABIO29_08155 [Sphingomicrobium sp.]